jgi:nucleoside 2-deoxyribosyltransferase
MNLPKVYLAGSIRGDRTFIENYQALIRHFESSESVIALAELSLIGRSQPPQTDVGIYERDKGWLDQADCMVADVSAPSLGVGYEIAYALHVRGIPVLGLHHRSMSRISAMISGNTSPLLRIECYENAEDMIARAGKFVAQALGQKR